MRFWNLLSEAEELQPGAQSHEPAIVPRNAFDLEGWQHKDWFFHEFITECKSMSTLTRTLSSSNCLAVPTQKWRGGVGPNTRGNLSPLSCTKVPSPSWRPMSDLLQRGLFRHRRVKVLISGPWNSLGGSQGCSLPILHKIFGEKISAPICCVQPRVMWNHGLVSMSGYVRLAASLIYILTTYHNINSPAAAINSETIQN